MYKRKTPASAGVFLLGDAAVQLQYRDPLLVEKPVDTGPELAGGVLVLCNVVDPEIDPKLAGLRVQRIQHDLWFA